MAEGSLVRDLGLGVVGFGVGFALCVLVTGRGGRRPQRPEAAEPLNVLMSTRGFEPRPIDWRQTTSPRTYSLGELLELLEAEGRSALRLKVTGDVPQRDYALALEQLSRAGVVVREQTSSPGVSGDWRGGRDRARHVPRENARGQYGSRRVA